LVEEALVVEELESVWASSTYRTSCRGVMTGNLLGMGHIHL
jgi:hypothetical protein